MPYLWLATLKAFWSSGAFWNGYFRKGSGQIFVISWHSCLLTDSGSLEYDHLGLNNLNVFLDVLSIVMDMKPKGLYFALRSSSKSGTSCWKERKDTWTPLPRRSMCSCRTPHLLKAPQRLTSGRKHFTMFGCFSYSIRTREWQIFTKSLLGTMHSFLGKRGYRLLIGFDNQNTMRTRRWKVACRLPKCCGQRALCARLSFKELK